MKGFFDTMTEGLKLGYSLNIMGDLPGFEGTSEAFNKLCNEADNLVKERQNNATANNKLQ